MPKTRPSAKTRGGRGRNSGGWRRLAVATRIRSGESNQGHCCSRICSGLSLQPRHLEGIATADLTLFEAELEPAHALRRGAVGEGVRHHLAARLFLQTV